MDPSNPFANAVQAPNYSQGMLNFNSPLFGQQKQQSPAAAFGGGISAVPPTQQAQQQNAQQNQTQNLTNQFAQALRKFMAGQQQPQPQQAMGQPGAAPAPNQVTGLW